MLQACQDICSPAAQAVAAPIVLRLCATYLTQAHLPDPILRFHCSNGATLLRLNWRCGFGGIRSRSCVQSVLTACACRADTSESGLRRSLGLMATYQYVRADLEGNRARFQADRRVQLGEQVTNLLGAAGRSKL